MDSSQSSGTSELEDATRQCFIPAGDGGCDGPTSHSDERDAWRQAVRGGAWLSRLVCRTSSANERANGGPVSNACR